MRSGIKRKYQLSGRRVCKLRSPRKAISVNVRTGVGSCFYQCPVKFSAVSSLIGYQETVDKKLRKEQAGFRKDKSCTYHIATLRIIVEQCIELQSSHYINVVDFKKAFDSIDRTVLWKLLRHYGLPAKCVTLIKNMHECFTCHVIFNGHVSEGFQIGTGVREGFLLSPLLFLIALDWTMKRSTEQYRTGIQ